MAESNTQKWPLLLILVYSVVPPRPPTVSLWLCRTKADWHTSTRHSSVAMDMRLLESLPSSISANGTCPNLLISLPLSSSLILLFGICLSCYLELSNEIPSCITYYMSILCLTYFEIINFVKIRFVYVILKCNQTRKQTLKV